MSVPAKAQGIEPDRSQLQQIVSRMTDGVMLIHPDRQIAWANQAALVMHGVTNVNDLGATVHDYQQSFRLTYRDGRELSDDAYPAARLCRGEQFSDVVVNVTRRARSEPNWVHRARGLVVGDPSGAPDCLVLVITDATEAFEAEERFESIFHANPAPALIARLSDLRYVRVNEGFLELSGFNADEIVGRTLYDLDILAGAEQPPRSQGGTERTYNRGIYRPGRNAGPANTKPEGLGLRDSYGPLSAIRCGTFTVLRGRKRPRPVLNPRREGSLLGA